MELINKEKAEMLKQYYTDAYKLGQQKAIRKEMGAKATVILPPDSM